MEKYIFDAEPHALDKETGYILKKIDSSKLTNEYMKEEILELYKKYAQYLIACDKEKATEYIMKIFEQLDGFEEGIVYRPPHMVGPLAQYGTLAFKFKRALDDTLVNP